MGFQKAANGVSQRVTNREIQHEDYKRCLIDEELMYHRMAKIGHIYNKLETLDTLKKSLSPYNDKQGSRRMVMCLKHTVLELKIYWVNIYIYIYKIYLYLQMKKWMS